LVGERDRPGCRVRRPAERFAPPALTIAGKANNFFSYKPLNLVELGLIYFNLPNRLFFAFYLATESQSAQRQNPAVTDRRYSSAVLAIN
jgi:hypothetical protein